MQATKHTIMVEIRYGKKGGDQQSKINRRMTVDEICEGVAHIIRKAADEGASSVGIEIIMNGARRESTRTRAERQPVRHNPGMIVRRNPHSG